MARPLALLLLILAAIRGGAVVAAPPSEYNLKAAFLYNFTRYVEWPEKHLAAGSPIRICILGRDPFGSAMATFEGRKSQGHDVRFRIIETVEQMADCHLVYVAESEERRVSAIIRAAAGRSILTVSDIDGFADAGGAIELVNEDDRVRFDINHGVLQREGLRASSDLLRLGRRVLGAKPP